MSTSVEIVIRGRDEFSPAFGALDNAFKSVSESSTTATRGIASMGDNLAELNVQTREMGNSAAGFSDQLAENLASASETHKATLEALAESQLQVTLELGEQLLQIEAGQQEARLAQQDTALAHQQKSYASHLQSMETDLAVSLRSDEMAESNHLSLRLERYLLFFSKLSELAASQNRSMAGLHKTLAVAEALFSAYQAANAALAQVPYPLNLAASAVVLAEGLANAERIRRVNVAHGGLNSVPEESTYLLQRGERVLSPNQNRDLTSFLRDSPGNSSSAGLTIQNLTIHVLENATNADAMLGMDTSEMRKVVADKIIPALNQLARLGIQPHSSTENV